MTLKAVVNERKKFTLSQIAKHELAVNLFNHVINSVIFREKFLALKLIQTEGLSNLAVYTKIMTGSEELDPQDDSEADVWVEMYFDPKSGVIGYTYENTKWTYLNSYFFDQYTPDKVAENLFHEWVHKIGFGHDFERTPNRELSVPYAAGYLIGELIRRAMKGEIFEQINGETPAPIEIPKPQPVYKCFKKWSWKKFWWVNACYWEYA